MKRGDVFVLSWDYQARRCCAVQLAADNPAGPSPSPLPPGPQGANAVLVNIANQTGITSTAAFVMIGLGAASPGSGNIVPVSTGRLLIVISGGLQNNTASDGAILQAKFGTGAAPANGAANAGTQAGASRVVLQGNAGSASLSMPFAIVAVVTGLTPLVPIWVDLAAQAITGGTVTIVNACVQATEF